MAEAVANQEHGIIILANMNNLFLCIVVDIGNFFSLGSLCLPFFACCTKAATGRICCTVLTL